MLAIAERHALSERCARIVRRDLCLGAIRQIDADTRFLEDLNADSLHMVTITVSAEEEFGVMIADDDAAAIETFGGMVDLVARLMRELGR